MLNYLNQILVQLNLRLRHRNEPELTDMNNGTHQAVPTRFAQAKSTSLVREVFTSNFWMSGLAMLKYIPASFRVKQVDGMAFFTESKHDEFRKRVLRVTPAKPRQWGTMSVSQSPR